LLTCNLHYTQKEHEAKNIKKAFETKDVTVKVEGRYGLKVPTDAFDVSQGEPVLIVML